MHTFVTIFKGEKDMKKKIISIILSLFCVISLVACGNSAVTENSDNEDKQDAPSYNESHEISATETNYLSECFSKNTDAIWYKVSDTSKDTQINGIYIFRDGTLRVFGFNNTDISFTLGQAAQMTDDEIISFVEQEYTKYYEEELNVERIKKECNEIRNLISNNQLGTWQIVDDTLVNRANDGRTVKIPVSMIDEYERLLDNKSSIIEELVKGEAKYDFHLFSDDSGNYTDAEHIIIQRTKLNIGNFLGAFLYFASEDPNSLNGDPNCNNGDLSTLERFFEIAEVQDGDREPEYIVTGVKENPFTKEVRYKLRIGTAYDAIRGSIPIYDAFYGGYHITHYNDLYLWNNKYEDNWFEDDSSLLTRVVDQTTFELDSIGTEGIGVD